MATRALGTVLTGGCSISTLEPERRAVLGANGAGKTTLFNAITGDFPPTAGRIRFFGEDVTTLPVHERIRRGLRRTYQTSLLFRGLSVLDNVYLAVRGVGRNRFSLLRPREIDAALAAARELLHAVHLEGRAATPVADLAHGEQRQLEIAMAMAGAPKACMGLAPKGRAERRRPADYPPALAWIVLQHKPVGKHSAPA